MTISLTIDTVPLDVSFDYHASTDEIFIDLVTVADSHHSVYEVLAPDVQMMIERSCYKYVHADYPPRNVAPKKVPLDTLDEKML